MLKKYLILVTVLAIVIIAYGCGTTITTEHQIQRAERALNK